MAIFAIIQQPGTGSEKLPGVIMREFEKTHYSIGTGVWLVAGPGTAQDISSQLGIVPAADGGSAIVIEAASYFGRANPAIWSWIKANWEARPVG